MRLRKLRMLILGDSYLRSLRLAFLMVLCAVLGFWQLTVTIGDGHTEVDRMMPSAIGGALVGLGIELLIRLMIREVSE